MTLELLSILLTVGAWAFFAHARDLWEDRKYVISVLCYVVCALMLWLGRPTPTINVQFPAGAEQQNPFEPKPQKYCL